MVCSPNGYKSLLFGRLLVAKKGRANAQRKAQSLHWHYRDTAGTREDPRCKPDLIPWNNGPYADQTPTTSPPPQGFTHPATCMLFNHLCLPISLRRAALSRGPPVHSLSAESHTSELEAVAQGPGLAAAGAHCGSQEQQNGCQGVSHTCRQKRFSEHHRHAGAFSSQSLNWFSELADGRLWFLAAHPGEQGAGIEI